MKRFECLQAIAPLVKDALFITTAGGATAEWNAVRPSDGNIQVKTLGLCSSIGLGVALALPKRKVFVFDGDGALWMNLGSLATIGLHQPKNLIQRAPSDRKSTRLNSSHMSISYAVFCLKKKNHHGTRAGSAYRTPSRAAA